MTGKVNRSTISGRFISNAAAARWPATTVRESVGNGTSNAIAVTRSSSTGRFVTSRNGDGNPSGTMRQRV
ncbi:Uncharacterised protein [Rhodococcus erythropolis]|nr:Uncharacterised protein [Rhodococcus erythropolis]